MSILAFPRSAARVLAFPSPAGTVRLVAVDDHERWIAEFTCRAEDLDERAITMLEEFAARRRGRQ